MLANNNLKVCRTLLRRDVRFHRTKYWILICAAMLVTALYSFVFLLGSSVEDAYLLSYQYSYGSVSHILYTGLTEKQADTLAENSSIKSTVRLSTIGRLSDPVIGQRNVKLAVTDRAYARTVLSVPTTGALPQKKGEIALDEFTMDSLGVPHEIGSPVTIRWTDPEGKEHTSEFVLCGWWASPTNFTEACAWITQEEARLLLPDYDEEAAHNVTLGVDLHQPKDLETQAEEILLQQGVSGCSFTTNLAYYDARMEQAQRQAAPFYLPALLVVICGYLMVYSIVHIASDKDRLYFAGLKSLGMTPRQIRRLLLEQGMVVSLFGMIPGWVLGFALHYFITGRVVTGMEENPALYFLSWQPFAAAILCTALTVIAAYLLPAVRLSRMTPAQTVRSASGRLPKRKQGANRRTTLMQLAFRTLGQKRWRMLLSVTSLLLAVLLLNSVWIRYISFKEDLYLSAMFPWDYSLCDGSAYLSAQQYNEKNSAITEKTVEELKSRPEVQSVSALKSREIALTASEELRERIVEFYNQPYDETQTLRDTQAGFPDWVDGLDRLEETGRYTGLVIGMDGVYLDYLLKYSPFTSGSFDAESFSDGNFVIAGGAYYEGVSSPKEGEQVTLGGHEFTVMASVMHDGTYLQGSDSRDAAFRIIYIIPLEMFDELFTKQGYRQLAVNIDKAQQSAFEAYLDEYEQSLNRGVGITRRSEYQDNFRAARLNTVLPDLVIGLVLTGIALMNFINMLVIKTVSRKGEFAVYESLGMTRAQLRSLLLFEGAFHAALIITILIPVTAAFDLSVMPKVVEAAGSWSAVYTCSFLPLWIFAAALVVLAAVVPLLCLHFITKGSLTERMRGGD